MTGASMSRVNSINNGRATKFCGLPYLGVFFDLGTNICGSDWSVDYKINKKSPSDASPL